MFGPGIYSITNKVNNKIYIGWATSFYRRWKNHKKKLKYNQHPNIHLQNAYNKYGKDVFKYERVEICSLKNVHEREDYWCKLLNTHNRKYGYNLRETGKNGRVSHSNESIEKIKKARALQIITQEHKDNISKGLKGYKRSKEEIEKALKTKAEKGYVFTTERRKKMSEAKKKYLSNPENRKKMDHRSKAVVQLTVEGEYIRTWKNAKEAASIINIPATHIGNVVRKKKYYNTSGGYKWVYEEEYNKKNNIKSGIFNLMGKLKSFDKPISSN